MMRGAIPRVGTACTQRKARFSRLLPSVCGALPVVLQIGATKAFLDEPNPEWNEDFFVDAVLNEDGTLSGTLSLQVRGFGLS